MTEEWLLRLGGAPAVLCIILLLGCDAQNGDYDRINAHSVSRAAVPDTSNQGDAGPDASTDGDTDADSDADSDTDTDADSDAHTDADTDADSDADTDADTDVDTDADADTVMDTATSTELATEDETERADTETADIETASPDDTHSATKLDTGEPAEDTGTHTGDADAGGDAGGDDDTDVDGDTDADADTDADTDTDTDTDADADSDSVSPWDTGDAPECEENTQRCDGNMAQQCRDGAWEDYTDCGSLGRTCVFVQGRAECMAPQEEETGTGSDETDLTPDAGENRVEGGACQCWASGNRNIAATLFEVGTILFGPFFN
jgi:hypothetical protein